MGASRNVAPIIIKKKKIIAGGGHHGGAWKVAYADFVTAMMAFFMLMWLLNATTEKQRKGLADYFSPSVPINRISGGGDGMFGGDSVFSEDAFPRNGTGASNLHPTESEAARGAEHGEDGANDSIVEQEWEVVQDMLLGRGGESTVEKDLFQHMTTRTTDEGLVIELFDLPGRELFRADTAQEAPQLVSLLRIVRASIDHVSNPVAVGAHVRAYPVVLRGDPVWPLSSGRAQRVRHLLESFGLDRERVRRVTGHADTKPLAKDPMSVENNRVEIILLRRP